MPVLLFPASVSKPLISPSKQSQKKILLWINPDAVMFFGRMERTPNGLRLDERRGYAENFGRRMKVVAEAVFVTSQGDSQFFVAVSAKFEPGADRDCIESNNHGRILAQGDGQWRSNHHSAERR